MLTSLIKKEVSKNAMCAPAQVLCLTDKLNWCTDLLGIDVKLIVIQGLQLSNGAHHCSTMPDGLHHISSTSLTLQNNYITSKTLQLYLQTVRALH